MQDDEEEQSGFVNEMDEHEIEDSKKCVYISDNNEKDEKDENSGPAGDEGNEDNETTSDANHHHSCHVQNAPGAYQAMLNDV